MNRDQSRLTTVILNFRTPEITIDCLRSLAPECRANPGMRVVLLDNASGDNSVERIREAISREGWAGDWLEFRAGEKNLGFSGGNNLILREELSRPRGPEFLMLLNSDTLVRPGCIAKSLAVMDADKRIGAMSCMLRNPDGTVQNVLQEVSPSIPRGPPRLRAALDHPGTFPLGGPRGSGMEPGDHGKGRELDQRCVLSGKS